MRKQVQRGYINAQFPEMVNAFAALVCLSEKENL